MKVGDKVECIHDTDWQNEVRRRDEDKAKKLGKPGSMFTSNAAAYMHADEAYVVEAITASGGLRLRGFVPTVSQKDVRLSTKPVVR
jgi:hypothetical protein